VILTKFVLEYPIRLDKAANLIGVFKKKNLKKRPDFNFYPTRIKYQVS
jgi:hypothetical protein